MSQEQSSTGTPLLSIKGLHVHFPIYGGVLRHKVASVKAVDGVSMDIGRGATVGLVGESGSGKTTVGRAICNLHRAMSPDVELSGSIVFDSPSGPVDVNGLSRREMLPHRAEIQMIFQDPFSSLNPRMTVQQIVEGPLAIHQAGMSADERGELVAQLLDRVGLQPKYAARYPHEFSGGQRQRIGIARSLATRPALIIADEPVSALDVSVQAQVINLMAELQQEFGLTYLFVAHDLSIVYHISDRIAVMYLGSLVEYGTAEQVYRSPRHPYSQALLSAVPKADPDGKRAQRTILGGDIPSPLAKPSGCGFRTRCPLAQESCAQEVPVMEDRGAGHLVACPLAT
ncbi:MAG: peptide ABC transporter substrate-binding protein [Planctomycetes bacterium]|jgi:oligopeptide/dipeptide ABC transporter ATP-binding protein|nr:peptide ABC transporter substrate-binding protein [Planctomycetota bacterium]